MQEAYLAAVESGVETFAYSEEQAQQQAEYSALARVSIRKLARNGDILDAASKVWFAC